MADVVMVQKPQNLLHHHHHNNKYMTSPSSGFPGSPESNYRHGEQVADSPVHGVDAQAHVMHLGDVAFMAGHMGDFVVVDASQSRVLDSILFALSRGMRRLRSEAASKQVALAKRGDGFT